MSNSRVVIVGGGVIGVCCAYHLVKQGIEVVVLERGEIGAGASYGSAGVIAPGHPPMNKPDRVKQALKRMFDSKTPLYIKPRFDPGLALWLLRFSANCTAGRLREGMRIIGPFGHATLPLFETLVQEEELDFGYQRNGYYEICRTEAGVEHAHNDVSLMRAQGYPAEALWENDLCNRFRSLQDGTLGGAYYPQAAMCNPHRFVMEMASCVKRYGGTFSLGQAATAIENRANDVTGVRTTAGDLIEADAVVLATGAYSLELSRALGCRLPIQPGKGYHRDLEISEGSAPMLEAPCVLGEASVFCTPMGGVLRLAGTMEFSGLNHTMRRPRLEQLTDSASEYLQEIGTDQMRSEWCGLRPVSSDGLPILGLIPARGRVFVATGHAMSGLTHGPVTGKLIAELVIGATPSLDIRALDPTRFMV